MTPEAFSTALDELELSSRQLSSDPAGATWLPDSMREAVRCDAECARRLAEFVEIERALFEDASVPRDAWFTARVMQSLPNDLGVPAAQRRRVLLPFYALAALVAIASWGELLRLQNWLAAFHSARHRVMDAGPAQALVELSPNSSGDFVVACVALLLLASISLLVSMPRESMLTRRS